MLGIGVVTYYVVPMAFLYGRFDLFLFTMTLLLLLVILGTVFLASLLQGWIERAIARTLVWVFCDRKLGRVVLKNMEGHKHRNANTAIMFTTALAFIIFTGASFQLIGDMLVQGLSLFAGAHLMVTVVPDTVGYLKEKDITAFLDANPQLVQSFTFQAGDLGMLLTDIHKHSTQAKFSMDVSGATGFRDIDFSLFYVDQNFFQTTFNQFYIPSQIQPLDLPRTPSNKPDAIAALYSDQNLLLFSDNDLLQIMSNSNQFSKKKGEAITRRPIKMLIPEGLRKPMSVDTKTPGRLCIATKGCNFSLRVSFRAMAAKMPGLFFSAYQQVQFFANGIISKQEYIDIVNAYTAKSKDAMKRYK